MEKAGVFEPMGHEPLGTLQHRMGPSLSGTLLLAITKAKFRSSGKTLFDSASTGAPAATVPHCLPQKMYVAERCPSYKSKYPSMMGKSFSNVHKIFILHNLKHCTKN